MTGAPSAEHQEPQAGRARRAAGERADGRQGAGRKAGGKQAARERVAAVRAEQKRAERRRNLITVGASVTAAVPAERAVDDLEHGAVWITYQPSLPASELSRLHAFFSHQAVLNPDGVGGSRYIDITPYHGLTSPIVVSSWGFQPQLTSPADPRLQQFADKFRASQKYTPEYGATCTGGVGTRSRHRSSGRRGR